MPEKGVSLYKGALVSYAASKCLDLQTQYTHTVLKHMAEGKTNLNMFGQKTKTNGFLFESSHCSNQVQSCFYAFKTHIFDNLYLVKNISSILHFTIFFLT